MNETNSAIENIGIEIKSLAESMASEVAEMRLEVRFQREGFNLSDLIFVCTQITTLNDTAALEARQSKDTRETLEEIVESTKEMNENLKNISHFLPAIRDRTRCGTFFSPEIAGFYAAFGRLHFALYVCPVTFRPAKFGQIEEAWKKRNSLILGR